APPAPPALTVPLPTPWAWRLGIGVILAVLLFAAYALDEPLGARFRAACGILFFFGVVALFSSNLRAVNWRTIGWGVALQAVLAVLVLKVDAAYEAFKAVGEVVKAFIGFSVEGAEFVFGNLARPGGRAL